MGETSANRLRHHPIAQWVVRGTANDVAWLELSESLEAMPARVDTPDVRFRLSGVFQAGSKAAWSLVKLIGLD
jgi:hypothetical protein